MYDGVVLVRTQLRQVSAPVHVQGEILEHLQQKLLFLLLLIPILHKEVFGQRWVSEKLR